MERLIRPTKVFFRIVVSASYKFYWDDCFSRASSLSYTTLFALVPVTAIMFAIVSGFNITNITEANVEALLQQVLPPSDNELLGTFRLEVFNFLKTLGQHVRSLGQVSVFVLVFTGIALLNTIQSALNVVWRVTSETNIVSKIISFWAIITLGPLLLAVSFYWYTKFSVLTEGEFDYSSHLLQALNILVPLAAIWAALTMLFYKLPAAKVQLRDAALGALIAGILFEAAKRGFAHYVSVSTIYSNFYGVLVTIPLFLFWLYLIWVIVLFGAEIAYQAGSIAVLHGLRKYATDLGEVGAVLGLRILLVIAEKFTGGEAPPSEAEIAITTGTDPVLVRTCLGILTDANLITAADPTTHSRTLLVSPDKLSLDQVVLAFHSKRYIDKGRPAGPEDLHLFLERIRNTSVRKDPGDHIRSWSLADLLVTNPK